MSTIVTRSCAIAVAAAVGLLGSFAEAATSLDDVRAAIIAGRLTEADMLIAQIDGPVADMNDLDFLKGTLAAAEHRYDDAIEAFHSILNRDPSLNRVRLDLARAFFERGDDEAAEHHFRIAEAAGLPEAVQANVEKILDLIHRRKTWSVTASVGVAPDSNANAATNVHSVTVYGLPFELNDQARQKSGIGATIGLGGTYQFTLDSDTRLIAGVDDHEVDYGNRNFDDRAVSGVFGPRFLIGDDAEVSVLGIANRRWYGETPMDFGAGLRVEGQWAVSPRWLLSAEVEAQQVQYASQESYLTGPRVSASVSATYGIDAVSSVRVDAAYLRELTNVSAFSDSQYIVGVTYNRDLPFGFLGSVGVNYDAARYDSFNTGFGVTLRYDRVQAKVSLSNRHLAFWGFTPVVTYTHTEQPSNSVIYAYSRDQGEIGLIRTF